MTVDVVSVKAESAADCCQRQRRGRAFAETEKEGQL